MPDDNTTMIINVTAIITNSAVTIIISPVMINSDAKTRVSRILLPAFGSAIWGNVGAKGSAELIHFLRCLKALIRDVPAVVMITFPAHLYPAHVSTRASHVADAVFRLDSFQGE